MRALRRLLPALLGLGLLASTLGGCEWPDGTRYVDVVFDDVQITRDVVYRRTTTWQGQAIDLRMDIYQPAGDTVAERPAVMWMFGGAWVAGDRGQMTSFATDSARRGYVGVSIDYRIRPGGGGDILAGAMDAYDDAVAAAQWLRANAAQYRIDPDAIIAGGYSAGGINALNLLYTPGTRGPATSPVAGAVAVAGLSFNEPTAGDPPALMHNGTNDAIVPYDSSRATCDGARRVGDKCRFYPYEGAGHEIAFTQQALILERTADFIFEIVLVPMGYRATVPASG
jgi:acetyl esterase/lipase